MALNSKLASMASSGLNGPQLAKIQDVPSKLAYSFNLDGFRRAMRAAEGQRVIAVSAGGTNLVRGDFLVKGGILKLTRKSVLVKSGRQGRGYFKYFKLIGKEAERKNIPVGVAYAAAIDAGTGKVMDDANLRELRKKIVGRKKLETVMPTIASFGTDSLMSVMAGVVVAKSKSPGTTGGIDFINGTGVGAAVYRENRGRGEIYSLSPEYVTVAKGLLVAGAYKKGRPSIEEAVSGPGIESMYKYLTGKSLSSAAIANLAENGDELALKLYSQSAYIGLFGKSKKTVVVLEGSLCDRLKVPGYADFLLKIVKRSAGSNIQAVYPNERSAPLSLEGAAMSAVVGL